MGDCPACADELVAFELEGLEIDHCTECRGTWLDSGELDLIAGFAGARPGPLSRAIESARGGRRSSRRCPRCGVGLRTIEVASSDDDDRETSGAVVELDACPRGHGLWFDRGELRATLCAFESDEAGAVAGFLGEILRHEIEAEAPQRHEGGRVG